MRKSYRFVVTGRVQGVFFRQSSRRQALDLGLDGWVRNRDDGAVEGVVAGSQDALDAFATWLRRGPRAAQVQALDWAETGQTPAAGYEVRR